MSRAHRQHELAVRAHRQHQLTVPECLTLMAGREIPAARGEWWLRVMGVLVALSVTALLAYITISVLR